MLQLFVSFAAGVYCGTEYNLRPYIDELKRAASRLERRPVDKPPEPPAEKAGWFSWKKESEQSEKKES